MSNMADMKKVHDHLVIINLYYVPNLLSLQTAVRRFVFRLTFCFSKISNNTVHRLLWLVGDYDGVLFFVHEKFEEIGIKIASFPNDLSQTILTMRLHSVSFASFLSGKIKKNKMIPRTVKTSTMFS